MTTINGIGFASADTHVGTDGNDIHYGVGRSELFYGSADIDVFIDAYTYYAYAYTSYSGYYYVYSAPRATSTRSTTPPRWPPSPST